MYSFNNDYTELAHPNIFKKMVEVNLEYDTPYGFDTYCELAQNLIRKKLENENVDVHFISGGTMANLLAISSVLLPFESILATDASHINAHETGAIEATGHKIYTFPHKDGKLCLDDIKAFYEDVKDKEYFATPKLVYISNTTEYGTFYTKSEVENIYKFCKENDLYLFIDGARMAFALNAEGNDIKYSDLPNICDMFYIGGTKNGALLGEALCLVNDRFKRNYKGAIKQRGAMLAKGRVMGIQFTELFKDGLYDELAVHANTLAVKLKDIFKKYGFEIYLESTTNQVFVIIDNDIIAKLKEDYVFAVDSDCGNNKSLTRFVTCWATKESEVEEFDRKLGKLV